MVLTIDEQFEIAVKKHTRWKQKTCTKGRYPRQGAVSLYLAAKNFSDEDL